jgi:uncharacterized protein YukE
MAAKQGQGNATTIALVTFVVLFLLTTVAAVVFYVKWDEQKSIAADALRNRQAAATDEEIRNFSAIVGEKGSSSYLGTVVEQFTSLYSAVMGKELGELTTAAATEEIQLSIAALKSKYPMVTTQSASLLDFAQQSAAETTRTNKTLDTLTNKVRQMEEDWARDVEGFKVAEDVLIAEKTKLIKVADAVQASYDEMKASADKSVADATNRFSEQISEKNSALEEARQLLAEAQNALSDEKSYRIKLENQLEQIKPRPDIEVAAYKPDGRIVSVNAQQKIVYLDLGSEAHVYRGLTFAVYDRANPSPEDGKGKGEIKVFDVRSKVSVARVVSEDPDNPVLPEDIIVNLIWDQDKPNRFYICGDYDFDNDGKIDPYGRDKVEHLIKQWGGIVADSIDINIDFVVCGNPPEIYAETGGDDADAFLAQEKLEEAKAKFATYNEALKKAASLSIPVFNTDRFKSLIGYNKEVINDQTI